MSEPVAKPATKRPAICLSMIVKNEVHIVDQVLDAAAPYISSWAIVDTGSEDGTQDLIRNHMARLGIPGTLYERPWRNFGHNRTEALALAQGYGDYIWQMDADDTVIGTPDFTQLEADIYFLRCVDINDCTFWRPHVYRDGVPVRWVGATHEHSAWDASCVTARLQGDYHIEARSLGARDLSGQKLERDRELLLADLELNPGNTRSVFYLAQTYFCLGDFANSHEWYTRRAEMGGWDEEVYFSLWRVAESMAYLGLPWPEVQDAYLKAWEFRPSRVEPLYAIARRYRIDGRYQLGYFFARKATEIPFLEADLLFTRADIYNWRAADEQAVCASWINKHPEAFTLCRRLLTLPEIPDEDRQRITSNRDVCVPAMLAAAAAYPDAVVRSLQAVRASQAGGQAGQRDTDVVVSLIAGPNREATEQTLNSFLHCCTDVAQVGRFLLVDAGLSVEDRATLVQRYGFLEFADVPGAQLEQIRDQIRERFWLHLGQGWRFFAPENFITRLRAVLVAEPQVFQVGVNFTDAVKLIGACAAEETVRREPDTGRYVRTDVVASGPAMVDTTRAAQSGTASLDEVLCITAVQ